jgi:hypothetical protein
MVRVVRVCILGQDCQGKAAGRWLLLPHNVAPPRFPSNAASPHRHPWQPMPNADISIGSRLLPHPVLERSLVFCVSGLMAHPAGPHEGGLPALDLPGAKSVRYSRVRSRGSGPLKRQRASAAPAVLSLQKHRSLRLTQACAATNSFQTKLPASTQT